MILAIMDEILRGPYLYCINDSNCDIPQFLGIIYIQNKEKVAGTNVVFKLYKALMDGYIDSVLFCFSI